MRQSQQFLENPENCAQLAEYTPDEPTQIAKPPGRLSCDSLARSSMILGNPTETTMGSDEKRSGEIGEARKSDDPDRTRDQKRRSN